MDESSSASLVPQNVPETAPLASISNHAGTNSDQNYVAEGADGMQAGYMYVPIGYMQQMQMMMSQMYTQITALTVAQNALQQAFQTMHNSQSQRTISSSASSRQPGSDLPDLNDPDQVSKWIAERKQTKANSAIKAARPARTRGRGRNKKEKPLKGEICKYFKKGSCSRGSTCAFKHTKEAKSSPSNSTKNAKTDDEGKPLRIYDFSLDPAGSTVNEPTEPFSTTHSTLLIDSSIDMSQHNT